MAGHGAENFIDVLLNSLAAAVFDKIRKYIAHQLFDLCSIQNNRHLPDQQGLGAGALKLKAQTIENLFILLSTVSFFLTDGDTLGHQQWLCLQTAGRKGL